MFHTLDTLTIHAPLDRVFALAVDIERWPELLSHYRYVRLLQGGGERGVYAMGARRTGIPVRWVAEQDVVPDPPRISYHHVAGVTRDMDVAWRFTSHGDGVEIALEHTLTGGWPLVASPIGQWCVGELFVRHIAQRTLLGIKRAAERGL